MGVLLVKIIHVGMPPHILRVHGRVKMDILLCIFHSPVSQRVLGDLDSGDLVHVRCGRVPEKMAMYVDTKIPGSPGYNMLNHPERYPPVPAGYKKRPYVFVDAPEILFAKYT